MNTLMEHYGIDPKSEEKWPILALALAADHVPGFQFQFKKSAGRKTDWDDLWYGVLYHEVEKVRGRRSASAACGILSKHTWNGKRLRPGTLENRYSQALKSAVVKARKHAQKGDPQLHQQIVEIWEQISQTLHQKTSTK